MLKKACRIETFRPKWLWNTMQYLFYFFSKWKALYSLGYDSVFFYSFQNMGSICELGRFLEEEIATHSSILAWNIPWAKEPSGLYPMGCKESHDWSQMPAWLKPHSTFHGVEESDNRALIKQLNHQKYNKIGYFCKLLNLGLIFI